MKKLLLLLLLAFAPATFASADLKIAVIDLGKAFDSYYLTKEARSKLSDAHDKYQKELQDLMSDYNHMGEELQTLIKSIDDPTLAPAAKAEKQKAAEAKRQDFLALQNRLQDRRTELDKELNEEMLRRHKEILDQIVKVVDDYSGPQGFDLVLDKSTVETTSGVSIILYNSSKLIDITQDIITRLNANAPATTGTAPSGAAAPATPAGADR
ncbi:MAG: OmpH family outer membrane protein [Verrucomicrobiota bacterium]